LLFFLRPAGRTLVRLPQLAEHCSRSIWPATEGLVFIGASTERPEGCSSDLCQWPDLRSFRASVFFGQARAASTNKLRYTLLDARRPFSAGDCCRGLGGGREALK